MGISSPDLLHRMEGQYKKRTLLIVGVFMLVVGSISAFGARWSYLSNRSSADSASNSAPHLPVISDVRRLLFGQDTASASTDTATNTDRMNILILGIGGAGHDGSNLTDSILITSVDLKQKKVGLVSIPRDLAYPLGSGQFEKINAVHAYAEQDHPGQGAILTAQAFSTLFDIHIDHVVRIDFQGFEKFIDALGGITVSVDNGFTDTTFPVGDASNAVKTLNFKKGVQQMDGVTALNYTRSRHGNNGEGSDFARSRRQQVVMLAVRDRLLSLGTLSDPGKLADLYRVISEHVQTDLSVWDLLKFAPLTDQFSKERMSMHTLTDAPDGILTAANVNGAYMLFPKKPDWSEIRALVADPFITQADRKQAEKPQETIRLEIKNGTFRTNFAAQAAAKLEESGYEITSLGNATKRGFDQSAIYDLTGGKKPTELARLQRLLNADIVSLSSSQIVSTTGNSYRTFPLDKDTTEKIYSTNIDFVLVLGDASLAYVQSH